jgi:hypothetical protein
MPRRKDLQSIVWGLEYDFTTHVGTLHSPPHQCCDMGGCIGLFEKIDPKVKKIYTVAGNKADQLYTRRSKSWKAQYLVARTGAGRRDNALPVLHDGHLIERRKKPLLRRGAMDRNPEARSGNASVG